jgi:hypothetical protein
LNQSLLNLVLDLGAGDDQVTLSQQADGRMKPPFRFPYPELA